MNSASSPASSRRSTFLVALGIVLVAANLRAPITAVGPLLATIQSELALSDSAAGVLNALPLVMFAALSLVAPAISRRFGAERGLGGALGAILAGTLMRSFHAVPALWLGTVLLSSGIAIANVLLPGYVKRRYPEHAAALTGMYAASMATFAGIGAGLAVPIAQMAGSGWRVSLAMPAVLAACTLVVWAPQMRAAHRAQAGYSGSPTRYRPVWKQAIGWQVSAFFAAQSFIFYSLVSWYATIAGSRGDSATSAGFALLLYQFVAIASNLGAAPVIKRAKDQRMIGLACGGLLLAGTIGLAATQTMATLWLMIAGLGAGLSMTTSLSLFALRSVSHEQASQLSGMAQFIGYAGAAAGPVLFGALRQVSADWTPSLVSLVIASALVAVFAYLAGRGRTLS
jgi:MFS transporter, CP family, cyanate transporter